MKNIAKYLIPVILCAGMFTSCKKTEEVIRPTSSLQIVNCLGDGSSIFYAFGNSTKISFSDISMGIAPSTGVSSVNYRALGLTSGATPFRIYSNSDSIKPIITTDRELKPGGIYSFFVSGTKSLVDTLFTKDDIPPSALSDSLVLFRTVNFARTSTALSVNVLGQASPLPGMENLGYKSVSAFLKIGVKRKQIVTNYIDFQVRNKNNNAILSTLRLPWNIPGTDGGNNLLSKPVTIVILNSGASIKCIIINPSTASL